MKNILWVLIFMPVSLFSQEKLLSKAEEDFNSQKYSQALGYFHEVEELVTDPSEKHGLYLKMAFCSSSLHLPVISVKYYNMALKIDSTLTTDQKTDFANVLIENGDYQRAKTILLSIDDDLYIVDILLNKCNFSLSNTQPDESILEIPMNQPIGYSCYGITVYKNKPFYILHKDAASNPTDAYLFVYEGAMDESIDKLQHIDLPLNFSNPSFDTLNKIFYFSGNATNLRKYIDNKREAQKIGIGGVNNLYIWSYNFSEKPDGFNVLPFNNIDYSCTHPCITNNGKTMYFSSNMLGGYGGFDIYVVNKTGDGWGTPVNLGRKVNTFLDDGYPFYSGGYLYFASEGHPGYGGLDIFKVNLKTLKVENLGKPVNSSFDDFSFTKISKSEGYFITNRAGNNSKDEIYKWITK